MSDMVERVSAFLKFRDESLVTGEADDAERAESAREIIGLLSDRHQWQPIETAPKDVQIMAWEPDYGWLILAWCRDRWQIKTSGNFWSDIPNSVCPVCWQPLPSPFVDAALKGEAE